MNLPLHSSLSVSKLAECFNYTSATYKFYWFLSIIQEVEQGTKSIYKKRLFARMISNAWYTVNYFHVSFGPQDLLQDTIRSLKLDANISIEENPVKVLDNLLNTNNRSVELKLQHFDKNVPHWFLSPWIKDRNRKIIYSESKSFNNNCLYALFDDKIEINPNWIDYLRSHAKVLKDFCFWNLCLFLQARNPNVPDIPNKLIKPASRNSLFKQRTKYWDLVFNELESIDCIYTGSKLTKDSYAVEHFIPYSFVSHDLIWNLIPADKSFNSSKGDKLPPLEKYFNSFYCVQKNAFDIINSMYPKNEFLKDYLTIFPDYKSVNEEKFKERISPLITIASNNGFQFL